MNKWHAGLLGLTLTCTLALPANATDIYRGGLKDGPPPPVYVAAPIWNGFYVGVNGGYGWTANDGPLSPEGGFGGGQIGYNWQGLFGYSPWVIGIEADFQGAGISDSDRLGENSLNWFGTVRGRLGYLVTPTLLLYGTAGLAYGGMNSSANYLTAELEGGPVFIGGGAAAISTSRAGWTAGGGLEWMFMPNWSAKLEYLYYDLGSVNDNGAFVADVTSAPPEFSYVVTSHARFSGNIVRAGINYHFNWGAPAPVLAKY